MAEICVCVYPVAWGQSPLYAGGKLVWSEILASALFQPALGKGLGMEASGGGIWPHLGLSLWSPGDCEFLRISEPAL